MVASIKNALKKIVACSRCGGKCLAERDEFESGIILKCILCGKEN